MARILAVLAGIWSTLAFAQSYPSKPIRLVIPNVAGGIDTYARVFLPKTVEQLGQPVVIENRPGASGIIGADVVMRSAPDGYTLMFATSAVMVIAQFLNRNVPFDTLRDFTPVSKVLGPVETVTVNASLPIGSIPELIEYARRNPGKLTYGSSGVGTLPHLNGEMFKVSAGVDLLHVPYKGAQQIATELVAGRIDVAFTGLSVVGTHVASGKLRLIGLMGPERYARLPGAASVNETLPGFRNAPGWFALFGPAALPRPIVDRVHGAVLKALDAPEVRASYDSQGVRVIGGTPEELAASMRSDAELTAKLVRTLGIKPE